MTTLYRTAYESSLETKRKLLVRGKSGAGGKVTVSGAKNSAVAVLPAAFLESPASGGLMRRVATQFEFPAIPVYQFWHRRYHADNFSVWLRGLVRSIFKSENNQIIPAPVSLY